MFAGILPVALRKESVDRNDNGNPVALSDLVSLSARRAWIEIACPLGPQANYPSLSARRAWIEIARNSLLYTLTRSLSARRAWIEIKKKGRARRPGQVALRKESVDRNYAECLRL